MKFLHSLFFGFCKIFFKIYCPLQVNGRENLPSHSFIFCSNHCSHMDTPVLMMASNMPFSSFAMIAARDYFFAQGKSKSSATLFMNLIPISRKANRKTIADNLELCRQFISTQKRKLIIYPEGTRSVSGEIQSFKRGPALIASELNLPIVPVYIQGTHEALGKGSYFPRPKKIKVMIGEPIHPETDSQQKSSSHYRKITCILEEKIKYLQLEMGKLK